MKMFHVLATAVIAAVCICPPPVMAGDQNPQNTIEKQPVMKDRTGQIMLEPMKVCVIGVTEQDDPAAILVAQQLTANASTSLYQTLIPSTANDVRKDPKKVLSINGFTHIMRISTKTTTGPMPYADNYTLYKTTMTIELCDPTTGTVIKSWTRDGISTSKQYNDQNATNDSLRSAALNTFDIGKTDERRENTKNNDTKNNKNTPRTENPSAKG